MTLCLVFSPPVLAAQSAHRAKVIEPSCPQTFGVAEAEQAFATAAGQYVGQYRRLVAARGLSARAADSPANDFLAHLTAALAQRFDDGTAVLFYASDDDLFSAWLIDENGIQAFHRAAQTRAQIETALASLRESLDVEDLAVRRLPPRLRPQVSAAPSAPQPKTLLLSRLVALTHLLLPDEMTCALRSVRHLIVVPIFDLGTVPYAALRPFDQSSSLIDLMSVTLAPSLPALVRERADTWSANFRQPLVVGNPYLPPGAGWESLQSAAREAQAVGEMFSAKPLIGREATRDEIIKQAAAADFLYFATHGAADPAHPLDGGFLVFSGPNGTEGLWTAREIQVLPLRARLAVLSACQTGLGQAHDAGVIGLARAFQLAGVPRVVMSLWSVYDDATADLMQAFARHLNTHAPAEALRLAMLEVKKRRPDPAEWASFVIFGTPQ